MTITTYTYEPLNEMTAIKLVKQLKLFSESEALTAREIGDGNLNLVFHIVNDQTNKSVIVKQALPYAKVVGESWPLSLKRATIESNALKQFGSLTPKLVPEVYYHDETLAVTVMEDLSHLTISRTGLIQGEAYPLLSEHVGKFLAHIAFKTSDFAIKPQEKKELVVQYINPDLCNITEDLVFTDPFFDYDTNEFEETLRSEVEDLWADEEAKLEVAKLKQKFLTSSQTLVHGDLHTGSIFASERETKVIDPEFAFYGPFGFDLGQFVANLLLNALSRPSQNRSLLFDHIAKTWDVFQTTWQRLWAESEVEPFTKNPNYSDYILQQTWTDAVGYAGCELIRRTIGLAHVADIDSLPDDNRLTVQKAAIRLGRYLLTHQTEINAHDFENLIEE